MNSKIIIVSSTPYFYARFNYNQLGCHLFVDRKSIFIRYNNIADQSKIFETIKQFLEIKDVFNYEYIKSDISLWYKFTFKNESEKLFFLQMKLNGTRDIIELEY